MRQIPLLLVCMASLLAAAVPAHVARAGDLDPSFSGDGRQTTSFGPYDAADATAIGPDGKIVVAGGTSRPTGPRDAVNRGALARYNRDGSLDRSFSGDGKVVVPSTVSASDVAIQRDGKIVVVDNSLFVLRLNANGTLDRTFSGDGRSHVVDFGSTTHLDRAAALALDSRGRIVLAGTTYTEGWTPFGVHFFGDFAVARLEPDGSLDRTFSGDGRKIIDFGASDEPEAVALQPDGKIVVAGSGETSDFRGRVALARLTEAGNLDRAFSGRGKRTDTFRGGGYARDLAIQPDGKIVVAGGPDIAVARYRPSGALDPSFSGDGKQFIDFGGADALALQRDGRIVIGGDDINGSAVLARLGPRGGPDRSFSGDGKVTTEFPDSGARDVEVQRDGKIVIAGSHGYYTDNSDFALARYLGAPGPACTVTGSTRGDVLVGTPGDDVICAGAGNDVVRAGAGNDTVYGGPGNDALRADGGSDRLYGQGGNDALNTSDGRRGNDSADGGGGDDACRGDPGDRHRSCSGR